MDNPSAPPGKAQKYARVERERRWLLHEPPAPEAAVAVVEITDLYFEGTRLRLRRMVDVGGGRPPVYKLTQKLPATAGACLTTNTYLSEHEYELLSTIEGHQLRKVRHSVPPFGIDVFLGPLEGLVLAEAEYDSEDAMAAGTAPEGATTEVTDDPQFTGAHLAAFGIIERGPAPWH